MMVPAWVVTTFFLRVWVLGLILLGLLAMSDFVFRSPHSPVLLGRRLITGLIWPLALFSAAGRQALFAGFLRIGRTPHSSEDRGRRSTAGRRG